MTGELVKAMRACPQPIIAAIDGVCVGAGAMIALFCDMRLGTPQAKTAFLFTRVGLAGCDMGACALLPRVIGHGRASELLYTGRVMTAEEGERWGFFNRIVSAEKLEADAHGAGATARRRADFCAWNDKDHAASGIRDAARRRRSKRRRWRRPLCMQTQDFRRAYDAFVAKQKPQFAGN